MRLKYNANYLLAMCCFPPNVLLHQISKRQIPPDAKNSPLVIRSDIRFSPQICVKRVIIRVPHVRIWNNFTRSLFATRRTFSKSF